MTDTRRVRMDRSLPLKSLCQFRKWVQRRVTCLKGKWRSVVLRLRDGESKEET
jgi:hypothetical protein